MNIDLETNALSDAQTEAYLRDLRNTQVVAVIAVAAVATLAAFGGAVLRFVTRPKP